MFAFVKNIISRKAAKAQRNIFPKYKPSCLGVFARGFILFNIRHPAFVIQYSFVF